MRKHAIILLFITALLAPALRADTIRGFLSGALPKSGGTMGGAITMGNTNNSLVFNAVTLAPNAPTGALAGAGAGNVDNGTHVYVTTCITATGETTASTASNTVTVADKTVNGKVTVTVPRCAFPLLVTGRNIYRSKAGTTTPLFRVAASPVLADNQTLTYTDNIADASLTATNPPTSNTTLDARLTLNNDGTFIVAGNYFKIDSDPNTANFLGINESAYPITTGVGNFGLGLHALHVLQTGINNTAVGWDSQMFSVGGNNNTSLGEDACKNILTGGDNNTCLGYTAGYSITTGTTNVAIAPNALYNHQAGNSNVAIGYNALNTDTAGASNVAVGVNALQLNSIGTNNTAVGTGACNAVTGTASVCLGFGAGQFETAGNALWIDNGTRSNLATGKLNALIYGQFDTIARLQTLTVNAASMQGGAVKTLVESSATDFIRITVLASTACAARIDYTVFAADATNTQIKSGELYVSAVANSSGTVTSTISDVNTLNPVSSGTLTNTMAATNGSQQVTFNANAVSSLTQTTLEIRYKANMLGGQCTIAGL